MPGNAQGLLLTLYSRPSYYWWSSENRIGYQGSNLELIACKQALYPLFYLHSPIFKFLINANKVNKGKERNGTTNKEQ